MITARIAAPLAALAALQTPLPPNIITSPAACLSKLMSKQIIMLDCDGVIYCDKTPLPNSAAIIFRLMDAGKTVLFVTNSSALSRVSMCSKLNTILETTRLNVDQMVPSCYPAAWHIKKQVKDGEKVYVIGGQGIIDELNQLGVECVGGAADDHYGSSLSEADLEAYEIDPMVKVVIVGLAMDFNYRMVGHACLYLQNNLGCMLVSCNQDEFDILPSGRRQPAAGVVVRAVEHASGMKAVDCGKPSGVLFDLVSEEFGVEKDQSVMVGDRVTTDIKFGFDHGVDTVLVMSGCSDLAIVEEVLGGREGELKPTWVMPYLGFGLEEEGKLSKL